MEVVSEPAVEIVDMDAPAEAAAAAMPDTAVVAGASDKDAGGQWADPSDDDGLEDQIQPASVHQAKPMDGKPEEDSGSPKSDFPEDLLSQAGLSEEQARKHFGSADELERALAWQDSQMLAAGRQMSQQAVLAPQAARQEARPAAQRHLAPVQEPQSAQGTPPQSRKLDLKLDPSVWDEQTIGLMNSLNDHYGKLVDDLHQRNQAVEDAVLGMVSHQQQQIETAYYDQFDDNLNKLEESYRDVFGSGTRFTLDKNSEHFRNRQRLDDAMLAIANGRSQAGHAALASQQLFDRALRSEFGNIRDAAVRKEAVAKVTKRQSSMLARPTNKKMRQLTSEEKAADFVSNFFREKGIAEAVEFDDYADGI